jgi:GTP cyclohydrolase I
MIYKYTKDMFDRDCQRLAQIIRDMNLKYIYGVPRGGIIPALEISNLSKIPLVTELDAAMGNQVAIIDDIVDSGITRSRFNGYLHFFALIEKGDHCDVNSTRRMENGDWVEFWWEKNEAPAEDAVIRLIQVIGDNPTREGLIETPKRVLKSYARLFEGYSFDEEKIKGLLKTFTEGACDDMVIVKDIEMYSCCEHHMLPFFGKCHIGYLPNGKVVGVSKLVRLMEAFARRMQIQERIGDQITEAIMKHLGAKGAACVIEAQHLCMKARGVEKQDSVMVTSSMKGIYRENPMARSEFMSLIRK